MTNLKRVLCGMLRQKYIKWFFWLACTLRGFRPVIRHWPAFRKNKQRIVCWPISAFSQQIQSGVYSSIIQLKIIRSVYFYSPVHSIVIRGSMYTYLDQTSEKLVWICIKSKIHPNSSGSTRCRSNRNEWAYFPCFSVGTEFVENPINPPSTHSHS